MLKQWPNIAFHFIASFFLLFSQGRYDASPTHLPVWDKAVRERGKELMYCRLLQLRAEHFAPRGHCNDGKSHPTQRRGLVGEAATQEGKASSSR